MALVWSLSLNFNLRKRGPYVTAWWRCAIKLFLAFHQFSEEVKMLASRNVSSGLARFLNQTSTLTSPVARVAPSVVLSEKIPVLADSKLNYAPPTGKGSCTTKLFGKNSDYFHHYCASCLCCWYLISVHVSPNVLSTVSYAFTPYETMKTACFYWVNRGRNDHTTWCFLRLGQNIM